MTFDSPTPLAEAIKLLRDKRLVPTALSSAELSTLSAEVKNAALFSARMTQLKLLEVLARVLDQMLEGEINQADAKLAVGQVYEALGYDAEAGGFPQDAAGTVPPAMRGTLRDLASQQRMELTIQTNYRMVTNAAFVTRVSADEQRRYQWPCFELVRIGQRRTPRGWRREKGGALRPVPGDDWPSRFVAAGGELWDGGKRMIAPKDSPVWLALGEGEGGYKDTLGNAFPPFAFGSGMGLREVSREEALTIGVIHEGDEIAKVPASMLPALKAQAKEVPKDILDAFGDDLEEDGDWLRIAKQKQDAVEAARAAAVRNRRVAWVADVLGNKGTRAGALLGWITRRGGRSKDRQRKEIRKGDEALRAAIQGGKDVEKAMHVPGLGYMDFLFGARGAKGKNEQGATHWGGWGVHHVDSKRGALAVKMLPRVLAKGRIGPHEEPEKRYVRYAGWTAVVKKRQKGRWSVTTLIDDHVAPKRGTKNARLPSRSTGLTTQVRTGLEFPGSTHARQLFAETGAGAAKASLLQRARGRCKLFAGILQRGCMS